MRFELFLLSSVSLCWIEKRNQKKVSCKISNFLSEIDTYHVNIIICGIVVIVILFNRDYLLLILNEFLLSVGYVIVAECSSTHAVAILVFYRRHA